MNGLKEILFPVMVRMEPKFFFRIFSRVNRIVKTVKLTEIYRFLVRRYLSNPLSQVFIPGYSSNTASICFPPGKVFRLFLNRYIPEILDSVVQSVTIYMVYLVFGPPAFFNKPNKTVCKEVLVLNPDLSVFVPVEPTEIPCFGPYFGAVPGRFLPEESSGFPFILENFKQPFSGNFGGFTFSHRHKEGYTL